MDLQEIKARAKAVWSTGDYTPTGHQLEPVSMALVESLEVSPEHRVLDVAAGHGNCALAAARRGAADVVATDFSPTMIERGRERTDEAALDITWQEADAADLPFGDGAFDRVTSVFGAIFAPEHETVAEELVRVTAPGGALGMTAWPPDGFIAGLIGTSRPYGPEPPAGAPDPMAWGDPTHVEAQFAGLPCELTFTPRAVAFTYSSWDDWRRKIGAHGMLMVLEQSLPADRFEEMIAAMQAFTAEHSSITDDRISYDAEYLEILARRRT